MAGYVKNSSLTKEVGPGVHDVLLAGGSIPAKSLVKYSGATVVAAGISDVDVAGVSVETVAKILNDEVAVVFEGPAIAIADVGVTAGDALKCAPSGKVGPALTSAKTAVTIEDNIGIGYANQPANDGIEIGSANAADTMPVDIWGTTNGGVVVVKERVVLTGTTFVSSVKTDWGVILGFEIPEGYPTAQGIITLREASANATIITLAAGARQSGVVNVTLANQRAFNHVISLVGDSGTTKTVGWVGTDSTGTVANEAIALTGATKVNSASAYQRVTKLLVGDLEVARTVTFKTDTVIDGPFKIIGAAQNTVVAGGSVEFLFEKPKSPKAIVAPHGSLPITGTTETEANFDQAYFLPANALKVGSVVKIKASGIHTATTGAETHGMLIKFGSTTIATTATTLNPADNDVWDIDFDFVVRSIGATGTIVGSGHFLLGARATAPTTSNVLATGSTSTSTTTVDTTAISAIAIAVDRQTTSTDGDSMRMDRLIVDVIL
jgi:hypothetical protein